MELCHSDCHVKTIYSTLGHLINIIEKLKNEDDPDPDLPRNTIKLLLEWESRLDKMAVQGSSGPMANAISGTAQSQTEREAVMDPDTKSTASKLKNCEQKLKNFKEKNKMFLEKNIELTKKNRELMDDLQNVTKENSKMKEQQEQTKRRMKQLTQQINQEKMVNGELEMKLQEMEKFKQDLTLQRKSAEALKQACIEKDRRIDLLQHRKKKKRQIRNLEKGSIGVKETFFGYEEDSIDSSETSSILSQSTISDEELCDELSREEIEKNYQKLMKEHMDLQRLHNILQKYCGTTTVDPERHFKNCQQLESDLFDATHTIENLRSSLSEATEESKRVKNEMEEAKISIRKLSTKNGELFSANARLKDELTEANEKIEDLEFQLEELDSQHVTRDSYNDVGVLHTIVEEPGEVLEMEDSPEDNMDKDKLIQHVHNLEQTAKDLQTKVVMLQQEKETLENKLKHHGSSLEHQEQREIMEAKVEDIAAPRQRTSSLDSNYSSKDISNSSLDLSFTMNSEQANTFSDSCVDFEVLSRESTSALDRIFDSQNMSSTDLSKLKLNLNILNQEICKIHEENVSLKNELHNSSIRQEELEQDENKMAEIFTLCKNLQDQVSQFDVSEKQLREKLKLAENTTAELEQSETQLRERTMKAEEKELGARRQAQDYLCKIEELKEIILDKDVIESRLTEKVSILEKAELISTEKINELEARNLELQQRLDLKEELEKDMTFDKKLTDTISELQSENDSLTMRCSELEENEEILRNNWEKSAQEHANRIQSLEEKIKTLESSNSELKDKLEEKDSSTDTHRPSLAIELSECDQSENSAQINQTIEFLLHRINNLEETLSTLEEAKNTKIESLQEQISKLKENEIKLSETISEMEREEKDLRDQLQSRGYSSDVLSYEGKIHELHRSQENLLSQIDSMEDFESDLKERMKNMEEKYEKKIEHLEKEIAQYIEQEQDHLSKINDFEKFETEMMEKLEASDEENQQLAEENRQLIDKVFQLNEREKELEKQILEKENFKQSENLNSIKEELDKKHTEKCHLEQLLQRTENELKQIQLENDDLNERLIELDSSEQECLEKLQKFENQAAELVHLRKKVEVLEDAEIKLMDRVKELEEIEQRLEDQIITNKDTNTELVNRINELEDVERSLRVQVNNKQNNDLCNIPSSPTGDHQEFHCKPVHLCSDKETDTIDLADVNSPGKVTGLFERLQDLENENQNLTEKLTNLTATDKQVKQLSEKIKMLEVAEDKLMERVMELEEVEDRLRGELRKAKLAENRLVEVEQELSEVQGIMEELNAKCDNLKLENNTLRNELHSSGSHEVSQGHNEANIEKIIELEHSKADLLREKENLSQSLSNEKAKSFTAENNLKELETKFKQFETKLEESESLNKILKENINTVENEKEKLLDSIDELEHKLQASEEDFEQFDVLKQKLEEKIERLEDELAQVEESEFSLKKDNIEVHNQNDKLTQSNIDIENNLQKLKLQLEELQTSKMDTESKLENVEKLNLELELKLENVQKSKDEIEKTIDDALHTKEDAERKMKSAELSRQQMENKLKDMDELYEEVQSNLENSKKTILTLKSKVTKADKSNMDLQLQIEKMSKLKTDAEKQLEIVRKSNSYLQSKVMKGVRPDNNQNSVESIHSDMCMTCGSSLNLPKQLSTFQGALGDVIQSYRDQFNIDTSGASECVLPSHMWGLDETFQMILKELLSCKLCIQQRVTHLEDEEKSIRETNSQLQNKYKVEVEDLHKTVSNIEEEKGRLQEQLIKIEQEKEGLREQLEKEKSNRVEEQEKNVDILSKSSQTEQDTMAGELEKPEDILRQKIVELEKLEKHLKKQVSDLESDRDELHEIARKDKNLIHEQNVRIRELQLAEKMLKEQAATLEASESNLYKCIEDLENDGSKMEDRIHELEILEMRLKELVRKYKLDEEVWLSKSANLETSVTELTVSEHNLKKQLESVEKEKLNLSEKSEYLGLRLKELENAEANLVQRMKDQENKEKALNERLSDLQSSGSHTEAQAVELHNANIVLTQQLNQVIQENAALVQQTSQLQSQMIMLEQQFVSLQDSYSQLKDEKHVLEKSEKELENKVREKRLSGVDIEEQLHKLEENEKTLKEKISVLQRSENRLKYKVQQMESFDSQDLSGMSGIPHKLEECQQRLILLRKQNIHLKSRLLEYQNLASSKSSVKLPQKEYKQMEARLALMEQTEAQMSNLEQTIAQLQQTLTLQSQGKQVPENQEEVKLLKERLQQNEAYLQIFRNLATDGQWDEILPILKSVNLVKDHQPTEGRNMVTDTSKTGQPLEELAKQIITSDLQTARHPHDLSKSPMDDYISKSKRGTDQRKPTADEKKQMINELISHLDKDSDDLDSSIEEIHWKTVESHVPVKQDRKWITVGQATSLHSSKPSDSRQRDEELVLGLDMPSESEGFTQNDTASNTSSPVLKRRKFLSTDISGPQQRMPPSVHSKTDSMSYFLPSSGQDSPNGNIEEVKGHNDHAPRSLSLHDSGHVTASTGRGTSLKERIFEIGKTLEKKSAQYPEETDEESLFTWKTKAFEAKRNFENAEKEIRHSKEEIAKLEKELEEKCRYIEILEAFVDILHNLLCNKETKSDREILNSMEIEFNKMKEEVSSKMSQPMTKDVNNELRRKDRELAAKRNEVDGLMQELRQWQEECRIVEDMRVNALESLRCLEQEISESQSSEKHLKDDYNQVYEQISSLEKSKEESLKTIATLKARIGLLSKKCQEKNNLLRRLKDEFCQGQGQVKSSALLEELKVMDTNMEKDLENPSVLVSNGNLPDQNDRLLTIHDHFVQGQIPTNPHFVALSEYDPTVFSKSDHPRLDLKLRKGDHVLVTGPLDDKGYFEAEVNGKTGLVPSAYLGKAPLANGHYSSLSQDRRWKQYDRLPGHLDTSPENIVQMYGQLVKQGRNDFPNKSNGYQKTAGSPRSNVLKQAIPDPPQDFQAVDTERGITLSWKQPATPVTGYKIFVDGKLHRHLTKSNITRLVLHSINKDRDHIFGIESVCDRQVSEIIDIFYGDSESNLDRILTPEEFMKLSQRQFLGIYDYDPRKQSPRADISQELAFNAGDAIVIFGEERRDGYFYGLVDGEYGLVPSYFVEEIPKSNRQKFGMESHKYNTR